MGRIYSIPSCLIQPIFHAAKFKEDASFTTDCKVSRQPFSSRYSSFANDSGHCPSAICLKSSKENFSEIAAINGSFARKTILELFVLLPKFTKDERVAFPYRATSSSRYSLVSLFIRAGRKGYEKV